MDSGENSLVGNLSDFRVVPSHHMGRPKKGHLVFNANFECGNLGRVDYVSDCEYDLFIRPDTCNPKHRVWFYFSVSNTKASQVSSSDFSIKIYQKLFEVFQRVIFNFVNFSKHRSLYRHGMAPVVRSNTWPEWYIFKITLFTEFGNNYYQFFKF